MTLTFIPDPATVLICDYTTGFMVPEMVKKRRVVIISPKAYNNRGLCTVVPISTTPPEVEQPHHVKFGAGSYFFLSQDTDCWAKCDLQAAVSIKRLDRIRIHSQFHAPRISQNDLTRIRHGVMHVIGVQP